MTSRTTKAVLAAVLLAAVTTACGTRRNMAEIAATYQRSAPEAAGQPSPGQPSASVDTGQNSSPTADTGISGPGAAATGASSSGTATAGPAGSVAGSSTGAAAKSSSAGPSAAGGPANKAATAAPAGGSGPKTATPTAPGGGSTSGAGGAPIKLGSVGTYSGIVGQNVAPGAKAMQAWAAGLNARGGLSGHKIDLVVADDGGDPARHVALIQQLVEKNGVIAFTYNAGVLSGQSSVDYVTRKRVPVIGSEMASDWFYSSPMFFPQGSSGRLLPSAGLGASADLLKPEGKSKVSIITCSDGIQICKDGAELAPKVAKDNGLQVVYQGQASLAQPDFTAECLNSQRGGADIVYIVMDANSANRIGRSCASVGYHPSLALNQQLVSNQQITDPNLQGSTTSSLVAPWTATNIPGVVEFQQAMARYAPGVEPSGAAMAGWVVGKMLERVAANGLPPEVTSQTILDGLWTFKDETLGGVTAPLTFLKEQPAPRRVCYGRLIIKDSKLVNPDNGKMICR